jgi:hypothetical protein
MSELLKGSLNKAMLENLKAQRKAIVASWQTTGLLDGLTGGVKINVAQLLESEASHMLSEVTESLAEYHLRRYNVAMVRSNSQDAVFHLTKLIHYTEGDIIKRHCTC